MTSLMIIDQFFTIYDNRLIRTGLIIALVTQISNMAILIASIFAYKGYGKKFYHYFLILMAWQNQHMIILTEGTHFATEKKNLHNITMLNVFMGSLVLNFVFITCFEHSLFSIIIGCISMACCIGVPYIKTLMTLDNGNDQF